MEISDKTLLEAYDMRRKMVYTMREIADEMGVDRNALMPDRLEVIQLAIELRDAAKAVAEMACDLRLDDAWLANYLETEVRPDYRALRKALRDGDRDQSDDRQVELSDEPSPR